MDEQEAGTDSSQEETQDKSSPPSTADESEAVVSDGDDRDRQEGQSGDALAWLEGPAFESPIEEMPTLQWPDVAEDATASEREAEGADSSASANNDPESDELEDAMQWLEELAREQGTPLDEMPTLISGGEGGSDAAAIAAAAAARSLADLGDTTPPPQLDSDPMAWLEQLAIDQNSPLEELPSVADRLLASEIASQTNVGDEESLQPLISQPVELDAALKYLEEQAAAQGIALDSVSIDEVEVVEPTDEDYAALDNLVVAGAAAAIAKRTAAGSPAVEDDEGEVDSAAAEVPQDRDDALVWLTGLDEEHLPDEEESPLDEEDIDSGDGTEEEDGSLLKKGAAVVGAAQLAQSLTDSEQEAEAEAGQVAEASVPEAEVAAGESDDSAEANGSAGDDTEDQISLTTESPADEEVSEASDVQENGDGSLLKKGAAVVGAAKLAQSLMDGEQEAEAEAGQVAEASVPEAEVVAGESDDSEEANGSAGEDTEDEISLATASHADDEPSEASDVQEDEGGSPLKKGAAVVGAAQMAQSLAGDEQQALDAAILDGMPDDPDEAMAWMGALSDEESPDEDAFQGDHDPEGTSKGDEGKDGSLLKKGAAAVAAAQLAKSLVDEKPDPVTKATQVDEEQMLDADILEGMPEDPDEAMAWMASLAVAENAPAADQPGVGPVEVPEEAKTELEGEADLMQDEPFNKARSALRAGDVAMAAKQYRELLDSNQGGPQLIEELETAVAEQPEEPKLQRILGDAYMQDGQLQKALKVYQSVV